MDLGYLLVQIVNLVLLVGTILLIVQAIRWARGVQRTLREIARRQEEILDLLRQK